MLKATKQLGLSLLSFSGALRIGEYLSGRNLSVLTYHRIVPRGHGTSGQRPPNTLFTDEFEQQMAFVGKRYDVLDGTELRAIAGGTSAISRNSIAITFDDGYENNFLYALPILQRHRMHAAFFLTTGLIGTKGTLWFDRLDRLLYAVPSSEVLSSLRRLDNTPIGPEEGIRPYFKRLRSARQSELLNRLERQFGSDETRNPDRAAYAMMSWDQVREMVSAGMTIGSHTESHQILAAVSQEEVRAELVCSRKCVEEETGRECWCFAYPNGTSRDFRAADELAVENAGYLCAFTQIPGSISTGSPKYALPRIPIPDIGDVRIFRSHVSGVRRTLGAFLPGG
jgi:peptidoglycan/xylan/chitin deacetylase (PgdA/CDA1 family)